MGIKRVLLQLYSTIKHFGSLVAYLVLIALLNQKTTW